MKSPTLATKNSQCRQKEQNHSQHQQLDYIRNQFSPTEADENYYYGTAKREQIYSGRSAISSQDNIILSSLSSHPNQTLRRTQQCFRPQSSLSPSPRLVTKPETGFGTRITDSNEIIYGNNLSKLNIYGSPAIRNTNTRDSDNIVREKKSLRAVVEFENDALRRTGGRAKVSLLNITNSMMNNLKQQQQDLEQQQILHHRSEFDNETSRPSSRRHNDTLKELEGKRETFGEWIDEVDITKNNAQNHAQIMAEVAIHQAHLSKLQQQQQYYMQDDDYNKQYYNDNVQQQQQQQQQ
ncbi:unnamed protein product, partial [Brugia timori]